MLSILSVVALGLYTLSPGTSTVAVFSYLPARMSSEVTVWAALTFTVSPAFSVAMVAVFVTVSTV